MSRQNAITVALNREERTGRDMLREASVRQMAMDSTLSGLCCLHVRNQVHHLITTALQNIQLTGGLGSFEVQCQGTFLSYIAVLGDELPVYIFHDTKLNDDEIICALKADLNIFDISRS